MFYRLMWEHLILILARKDISLYPKICKLLPAISYNTSIWFKVKKYQGYYCLAETSKNTNDKGTHTEF